MLFIPCWVMAIVFYKATEESPNTPKHHDGARKRVAGNARRMA